MPLIERLPGVLHYELHGDGPPLMLIHGGLVDSRSWSRQRALAERFMLLLPDTRNAGLSRGFCETTMTDLVEDLGVVLDDARVGPVHVLGFSIGGLIAQAFALRYPETVTSLVLVSSTANGLPLPPRVGTGVANHVERAFSREFRERERTFIAEYVAMATTNEEQGYGAVRSAAGEAPSLADLGTLACPTLVVHATDDASIPIEHAQVVSQKISSARLVTFDHVGHSLHIEAPERFNAIVSEFVGTRK